MSDIKSLDEGKYKAVLKNKVGLVESKEAELVVSSNFFKLLLCFL